ncbi:MAG: hypothetical protein KGR26_07145 [Cyanobacteria bacterium REEB65]|nr:hypothetical protein [Cyanobacteria bacterium REEB65]
MPKSRPWLPPVPLVGSQVALGCSWGLLAVLAAHHSLTFSLPGLAWVHLVALGWLSLLALTILFHVIPGFLDVQIPVEGLARWMLGLFMVGVALLVVGFWQQQVDGIAWGGAVVSIGLLGVVGPFVGAIGRYAMSRHGEPNLPPAPFFGAFMAVFVALAVAAGIGLAMAGSLDRWWSAAVLALAPVHAHLAAGGWLTLLVMGVSMRTLVRLTGVRRSSPALHWLGSTGFLVGILLVAWGLAADFRFAAVGGALLCALACLAYVMESGRMVLRSGDPHAPVRAFLASALAYLLVAAALGLLILAGHADFGPAYVYVALIGWLGQMVAGHSHHIPIRFLLTQIRGEHDDTEPGEVLVLPLSWTTWAAAQGAVIMGAAGLLAGHATLVELAAACGLLSWLAQMLNFTLAARTALAGCLEVHSAK